MDGLSVSVEPVWTDELMANDMALRACASVLGGDKLGNGNSVTVQSMGLGSALGHNSPQLQHWM